MSTISSTSSPRSRRLVATLPAWWALLVCLLFGGLLAPAAAQPTVSNVQAEQRAGTKLVDVSYDLAIAGGGSVTVALRASKDGGATFETVPATLVAAGGAYGAGQTAGTNKTLVWDASGQGWAAALHADTQLEVSAASAGNNHLRMVLVSGGSLPSNRLNGAAVDTFYIGECEVTWGEWNYVRSWANANGYDIGLGAACGNDNPVHSVSKLDTLKWCNAKSEMEGLRPAYIISNEVYKSGVNFPEWVTVANGYRLPTEVEWEFAARGGTQTRGYAYSGANDLSSVGWFRDNSGTSGCSGFPSWANGRGSRAVGQKEPNELGIYDMSGNLYEICFDYSLPRGGSWDTTAAGCTVSFRGDFVRYPDTRTGFRLARNSNSDGGGDIFGDSGTHSARSLSFALDLRTVAPLAISTSAGSIQGSTIPALGPVTLTAAVNVAGVAKVEFWVDGLKIGEDTASPYGVTWLPLYAGNSTVTAKAMAANGTELGMDSFTCAVQYPIDRIEPDIVGPGLPTVVANTKRIMPYLEMRRVGTGPSKTGFGDLEFSSVMADVRLGNGSPVDNGEYNDTNDRYTYELSLRMLAATESISAGDFASGGRFFLVAYGRDAVGSGLGVYFPLPPDATFTELDADGYETRRLQLSIPATYFERLGLPRSGSDNPKLRLVRRSELMVDSDAALYSAVRDRFTNNTIPSVTTSTLTNMESQAGNRLVILLHGWQKDNSGDPYNEAEFKQLTKALLKEQSDGSLQGWTVLGYNWSQDAATGGLVRDNSTWGLNSDSGSRAAATGYEGGLALGYYLKNRLGKSGMAKLHLIAHSAGTWAAYGVLQQLRSLGLNEDSVQVTLLDPYMPSDTEDGGLRAREQHLFFGKEMWSGITNVNGYVFIRRLENYYTNDVSGTGTEQVFSGDRFYNANVSRLRWDWESQLHFVEVTYGLDSPLGAGHGGPIRFLADSTRAGMPRKQRPDYNSAHPYYGWPVEEVASMGWKGSLARQLPSISFETPNRIEGVVYSSTPGAYTMTRGSDSALGETVSVPAAGGFLAFRYSFPEAGEGDRLVVRISEGGSTNEVWSYLGTNFVYDGFLTSGEVSLDAFASKTVTWELRLQSVSGEYAEVTVTDIRFYSRPFELSDTNEPFVSATEDAQTVAAGSRVELLASVFGPGPMTLRWQRNQSDLPATWYGAATNTAGLTLSGTDAGADGAYRLKATNAFGTAYGAEFTLTVDEASTLPAMVQQPESVTRRVGESLGLSVGAVTPGSDVTPSYQWLLDGDELPGQTDNVFHISQVTKADEGVYSVRVTNDTGSIESAGASVTVLEDEMPSIVAHPVSAEILAGASVALNVIATGNPTPGYQWRKNGGALSDTAVISGSKTATLILRHSPGLSAAGSYDCVVSNTAGSVPSQAATISVSLRPASIMIFGNNGPHSPLEFTYTGSPIAVDVEPSPLFHEDFTPLSYAVTYNGGTTPPTNAGTYTVVATLTEPNYKAATDTKTMTIAQAGQTITFPQPPNKTYGDAPFTVSASASSGLPVTLSVKSGPATISGTTVTITGAGTVTLRAEQAGNTNYTAAPAVERTFTAAKRTASVVLSGLSTTYNGSPKSVGVTTTPAGLALSVTYNGSTTAPTNAGSYPVAATVTDINHSGSATGTLVIAKATQTISFDTPASVALSAGTLALSASASSGLSVTFSVVSGPATVSGSTLTLTGGGAVQVKAVQTGDTNWLPAELVRTITVTGSSSGANPLGYAEIVYFEDFADQTGGVGTSLIFGPANQFKTNQAFSMAYWVKETQTLSDGQFVYWSNYQGGHYADGRGYLNRTMLSGSHRFILNMGFGSSDGFQLESILGPTELSPTEWNHHAIVYNPDAVGTKWFLYVNGAARPLTQNQDYDNRSVQVTTIFNEANDLGFFRHIYPDTTVEGNLDNVAVWMGRALTTSDVAKLMESAPGVGTSNSITPINKSLSASAQNYEISVTASGAWTADESLDWASVAPTSGNGSGSVTVSVTANSGAARSGTVNIAGIAHTLDQAAGSTTPVVATITPPDNLSDFHFYDGQAKEFFFGTDPEALPYAVTYNGSTARPRDAGTYEVVVTITAAGFTGSETFSLTIAKASQTLSFGALPESFYNGQTSTLALNSYAITTIGGGAGGLPPQFTSSNPAVATVSGSTLTVVGPGTTTITARQPGDANHEDAGTLSRELRVIGGGVPPPPSRLTLWPGSPLELTLFTPASDPAVRYYAKGLPAGLKLNARTGEITGTVSASAKPGTYSIQYWTQVGRVKSEVSTREVLVEAFPTAFVGTYDAVLNKFMLDTANLNRPASGRFEAVVNRSGAVTGTFIHAGTGKTYPLRSQFVVANGGTEATAIWRLVVSKTETRWLTLYLDSNRDTGVLLSQPSAELNEATFAEGNISDFGTPLKRGLFTKTTPAAWLGRYTGYFKGQELGDAAPQGASHALFVVSNLGRVAMTGRAADGQLLSASFSLAATGEGGFFINPYRRKDSGFGGVLQWRVAEGALPARAEVPSAHFPPSWSKAPGAKDLSYRNGFGPLFQFTVVRAWTPPARGQTLPNVMPAISATQPNGLVVYGAGIDNTESPLKQQTLNPYALPGSVRWVARGNAWVSDEFNPAKWSAVINPATGAFSGTFRLVDTVTSGTRTTTVSRTVPFNGVLIQRGTGEDSFEIGGGYFLLPASTRGGETRSGLVLPTTEPSRDPQWAPLAIKTGDVLTLTYDPNDEIRRSVWAVTSPTKLRASYTLVPRGSSTAVATWEQLSVSASTSSYRAYLPDETLTVQLEWTNATTGTWTSDDGFSGSFVFKAK